MNEKRSILNRIFVPQYDELALFLMSFAFILLFITHEDLRAGAVFIAFAESPLFGLLVLIFFGQGIALSLYHAFCFLISRLGQVVVIIDSLSAR